MVNCHTKLEVSIFIHYDDMKGNAKCKNWGCLGRYGSPRLLATSAFDRVHMTSYMTFRVIAS